MRGVVRTHRQRVRSSLVLQSVPSPVDQAYLTSMWISRDSGLSSGCSQYFWKLEGRRHKYFYGPGEKKPRVEAGG